MKIIFTKKLEDKNTENYNFTSCFNGSETRSLALRTEHRLRVLENRALRTILGLERERERGTDRRIEKTV
jgi:hypothetical protein